MGQDDLGALPDPSGTEGPARMARALLARVARMPPRDRETTEAGDEVVRLATSYARAIGAQCVELARERHLLQRREANQLADWEHPELERDNYERARALIDSWREHHVVISDVIAGDRRAIDHAKGRVSSIHRGSLTAAFVGVAAVAGYHFWTTHEPLLAGMAAAASILANVSLGHGLSRYAPRDPSPRRAAALALMRAAFVDGIRARDPRMADRAAASLDDWLAAFELELDQNDAGAGAVR